MSNQKNEITRPDPDALLAAIQQDEKKQHYGKLKIFFDIAAGVGKTYSMLPAARQALAESVNAVVGYVETHGRAETEALRQGLPVISHRRIEYRGTMFEEMNLDAILNGKPLKLSWPILSPMSAQLIRWTRHIAYAL